MTSLATLARVAVPLIVAAAATASLAQPKEPQP